MPAAMPSDQHVERTDPLAPGRQFRANAGCLRRIVRVEGQNVQPAQKPIRDSMMVRGPSGSVGTEAQLFDGDG